jgi:hypothetical protein
LRTVARQDKCPETLVLPQRHADPIDLAADEIIAVIGAHRTAENNRGGMLRHSRRQRLAEARPPHVKRVAKLLQGMADAAGPRVLLVQDDEDRMRHKSTHRGPLKRYAFTGRTGAEPI